MRIRRSRVDGSEEIPAQTEKITPSNKTLSKKLAFWKHLQPKKIKTATSKHPRRSAAILILVLALILVFSLPVTRYRVLGLFIKGTVMIRLLDATSSKPVSEALVEVAGKSVKTDADGQARIEEVPLGTQKLKITKSYYETFEGNISVGPGDTNQEFKITATGKQVNVKVQNKISEKPIPNALISFENNQFRTDESGLVQLILPSDANDIAVNIEAEGFNKATHTVTALEGDATDPKNIFGITPQGKIYFLSKRTGKIDVMKSDLDGSQEETVLKGTGFESDYETTLLGSADQRYLALSAKRDNKKGYEALYLIDTQNGDKLIVVDEGDAVFQVNGWTGSLLVYTVIRNVNNQAEKYKLKVYDGSTNKLKMLDASARTVKPNGAVVEQLFSNVLVNQNSILYSILLNGDPNELYYGEKDKVVSIKPDGADKRTLVELNSYDTYDYSYFRMASGDIPIAASTRWSPLYFKLSSSGNVESLSVEAYNSLAGEQRSYAYSPSGSRSAWTEYRDGKNILFTGKQDTSDSKQVASLDDYQLTSWYNEDYILLSMKGSELYIIGSEGGTPLKVINYHGLSFKHAENYYH